MFLSSGGIFFLTNESESVACDGRIAHWQVMLSISQYYFLYVSGHNFSVAHETRGMKYGETVSFVLKRAIEIPKTQQGQGDTSVRRLQIVAITSTAVFHPYLIQTREL
jgi:hypothetical protein